MPLWRACVSRTTRGSVLGDELNLLLIDPSDDDRALATTLLRSRSGTTNIEAIATVAALMASLARGGFDVVVAEYRTPWIEGPALLDAITQACPGVPVIFLTSTDDTERAVAMMRAGAADYLVKSSRGFLRLSTAVDDAVLAARTDAPSRPPDVADPPAGGGDPARQERINTELRGLIAQMRAGAADYLVKSSRSFLRLSTAIDEAAPAAGTGAPSRPQDGAEDPPASGGDPARQERINTELRGLIAQAVHELDAPLRLVAQQAKMVGEHAQGLDGEGQRSLGLALEGVSRMQELLDDLAAYSRIEAEPITFESCECDALVDRVARQLEVRFGEANVRIQRATLPAVRAVPSQLTQVFENLISNGLKFQTEKPARVEIWAKAVGEEWQFSVRDYGLGVEPEFADRIFDLFKRLRPEYPGSGVGLAICRRIVERHGGRIWVESSEGGGATFTFTLSKNPTNAGSTPPFAAVSSPRRRAP